MRASVAMALLSLLRKAKECLDGGDEGGESIVWVCDVPTHMLKVCRHILQHFASFPGRADYRGKGGQVRRSEIALAMRLL